MALKAPPDIMEGSRGEARGVKGGPKGPFFVFTDLRAPTLLRFLDAL